MALSTTITLSCALAGLLSTATVAQQTPTEAELRAQILAKSAELTEARVSGLREISVNGKALEPERVRRETIYLIGAKQVEGKIAEFFIQEQMEEAIKAGRDAKEFEISEEELVADIKTAVEEFQVQNPGVEFWDAVRSQYGLNKEQFLFQRRQTKLFDLVFFPGPAKDWPLITREAIIASAQGGDGKQFWENLVKASVDEEGNPRELPAFWMHLCRSWVQKQLKKWSDIRYPSDGLPPTVCLRVNEREWKTDAAFEEIRGGLYTQDLERATTEVVVREVLRQELEKAGHYMTDEQFRAEFDEYRQEYDDTPFTTEVIATAFKGYPSLEAFCQRWRLMRSYERMIADEVNDDSLQAHAEKFKAFFADGQVSVDVIQFLARDAATGAWQSGGLVEAGKRATTAMEEIKNGKSFDDVLASKGEYFTNDKERGRLGAKPLNQIRQALRENEFSDLLTGYSVSNYLFYEAEVGQIVGPLRGPEGWYVARVNVRTPARGPVSVADDRTRTLVTQDYSSHRFMQWANEVVQRAKIQ